MSNPSVPASARRGLAALALLLAAGCSPADARDAAVIPRHGTEGNDVASMNYDPVDIPLAWTAGGDLVVAHSEMYSRADVFSSGCPGSGFYAVTAAGGAVRPLAVGGAGCRALGDDGMAASADGEWIVFSESVPPNNSRLARLHLGTGRVDTLPSACAVYLQNPAISSDGRRIAAVGLCRDREQKTYAVYMLNSDGSGLKLIVEDRAGAVPPSWSPDGQRLAATVDGRIVVLAPDGTGRSDITTGGAPAWSPDGRWIAFLDDLPGERRPSGIFVVRPDGSGRKLLFRNRVRSTYSRGWGPDREGEPGPSLVWSPDSRWIAFSRRFDRGTSVWRLEVESGRVEQVTRPSR